LRRFAPDFDVRAAATPEERTVLAHLLTQLTKELVPVFVTLGVCEEPAVDVQGIVANAAVAGDRAAPQQLVEKATQLLEILGEDTVVVAKSAAKKRLKNIGVNPQRIVVTNGPLFVEDLPQDLPPQALANIGAKIGKVHKELAALAGQRLWLVVDSSDEGEIKLLQAVRRAHEELGLVLTPVQLSTWEVM
jgi:hypothetical protein